MELAEVVLIACSKSKLDYPAPARKLYQGLLFKLSVRYAEEVLELPWVILSTKYGVVMPDDVIEPYSHTLSTNGAAVIGEPEEVIATTEYRGEWNKRVRDTLVEKFPDSTFISLLGKSYMGALRGLPYEWPLANLKLGPRIVFLQKRLGIYKGRL